MPSLAVIDAVAGQHHPRVLDSPHHLFLELRRRAAVMEHHQGVGVFLLQDLHREVAERFAFPRRGLDEGLADEAAGLGGGEDDVGAMRCSLTDCRL